MPSLLVTCDGQASTSDLTLARAGTFDVKFRQKLQSLASKAPEKHLNFRTQSSHVFPRLMFARKLRAETSRRNFAPARRGFFFLGEIASVRHGLHQQHLAAQGCNAKLQSFTSGTTQHQTSVT